MVEPFVRPRGWRALAESLASFLPFFALNLTMMVLVRTGHMLFALVLAAPAAGFLVRIFIIFHDCCHGSFFPSRRANRIMGYASGLLTLTPFEKWQHGHADHHATVGDLDRRGAGDVWTLTVAEYRAAPRWKRGFYWTFRNPFIMFGIGPAIMFVFNNRRYARGTSRRERFSVHFTNAAIAATLMLAYLTVGLRVFLITQVSTLLIAATAGVWLFYVQHQFEDVYWARRDEWDPIRAALEGSSYYKLPALLQWFTGSIGLHHIHHVQPRVPFYNLQRCQNAIPEFQAVRPLTFVRSLRSLRLRLIDETGRRMVTWADMPAPDDELGAEGGFTIGRSR